MLNDQIEKLTKDLNREIDDGVADVTYTDAVKIVQDRFLYHLIKITPKGDVHLKKDEAFADFEEGEILSIPPLENYPEGLSLKISRIEEKQDSLIIQTEEPKLEEVFSELNLDFEKSVQPEDLVLEEGIEVEMIPIEEPNQTASLQSFLSETEFSLKKYLFTFDKSLLEYEGDDSLASLRLDGEFLLEGPTLSVKVDYSNILLKEGSISLSGKQNASLRLRGDVAADYERSIKLATIKLPVKNAFSAEVVLSMKITASGEGYVEVKLVEDATINAEVQIFGYKNKEGHIEYAKSDVGLGESLKTEIKPINYDFTGRATAGPTLDLDIKYNQLGLVSSENSAGVEGRIWRNEAGEPCFKYRDYITSEIVWKFIVYEEFSIIPEDYNEDNWSKRSCLNTGDPDEDQEDPVEPELFWKKTEIGVPSEVKIGPEGNLYYTESGGTFVSLTPAGEQRWERKRPIFYRSPVVTEVGEIFAQNSEGVMAYDLDGEPLWTSPVTFEVGRINSGHMAMMDDLLIVPVTSAFWEDRGSSVYAVTKDGDIAWEANLLPEGDPSISSVEVSGDQIFIVSEGSLYKINAQGEVETLLKDHYLSGKPAVAEDGTVYVISSLRYKLYAVSPETQNNEEPLWSVSTDYLFSNDTEPRVSPKGEIYLNGANKITIVNPKTKQIEASYGVEYKTFPVMFDDAGNSYVASSDSMTDTSSIVVFDNEHKRLISYVSEGVKGRLGGPLTLAGDGVVYSPGINLFAVKFYDIND
ncbi:PQQ-binding-like beta-propeller repeat protein [Halobacillus faecis]|nr:PQQ-binding-like beta-propeller repeat protein [Halobacillus faecis]